MANSYVTFHMMRHGTTNLNSHDPAMDRVKGWMDTPLDEDGQDVAQSAATYLQDVKIKDVISSDLTRAVQTAKIIGKKLGAQVYPVPSLRPWDVGKLSGMKYTDVQDVLKHYQSNPQEKTPGGESYQQFYDRFKGAFPSIIQHASENPTLVVLHSRHILALPSILNGDDSPKVDKVTGEVPPGGILKIRIQNESQDSQEK